jgi:hypothetical protein
MRLDPQSARAGYIAGRQSILAEAEALRGEMREHVAGLQRELAELIRSAEHGSAMSYRAGGFQQRPVAIRRVAEFGAARCRTYRLSGRGLHFRGDAVVVWERFSDAQVPTDG